MSGKPFSPDTLADRWGVSGKHIREMCAKGTLSFFRVGKLYRIPADVVEGIERGCGSSFTGASGISSGMTAERDGKASAQPTGTKRKERLRIIRGPDGQATVTR